MISAAACGTDPSNFFTVTTSTHCGGDNLETFTVDGVSYGYAFQESAERCMELCYAVSACTGFVVNTVDISGGAGIPSGSCFMKQGVLNPYSESGRTCYAKISGPPSVTSTFVGTLGNELCTSSIPAPTRRRSDDGMDQPKPGYRYEGCQSRRAAGRLSQLLANWRRARIGAPQEPAKVGVAPYIACRFPVDFSEN